jgi:hypothetical protein
VPYKRGERTNIAIKALEDFVVKNGPVKLKIWANNNKKLLTLKLEFASLQSAMISIVNSLKKNSEGAKILIQHNWWVLPKNPKT